MTDERSATEPVRTEVLPRHPARRWGRPSDFAAVAVALAADASQRHTGDTITIDGASTKL